MDRERCCRNCIFFQAYLHDGIVSTEGVCKKYPPVYFQDRSQGQPKVKPDNWCGEFLHIDEWFMEMDFSEMVDNDDDLDYDGFMDYNV